MIFSLEMSYDGHPVILQSENCIYDAWDIYGMLADTFPNPNDWLLFKDGYIGCFNGAENCVVFNNH